MIMRETISELEPGRIQTALIPAQAGTFGNLGRDSSHLIPACVEMNGTVPCRSWTNNFLAGPERARQ